VVQITYRKFLIYKNFSVLYNSFMMSMQYRLLVYSYYNSSF